MDHRAVFGRAGEQPSPSAATPSCSFAVPSRTMPAYRDDAQAQAKAIGQAHSSANHDRPINDDSIVSRDGGGEETRFRTTRRPSPPSVGRTWPVLTTFDRLPTVSDVGCMFVCIGRRQRSFNWQSTAFVMRGLWVRLPPLALFYSLGSCALW